MMRKSKNKGALCGLVLCLLLAGCGGGEMVYLGDAGEEMRENPGLEEVCAEPGPEEQIPEETELCVYVCGAVNSPGLVRLPEGSRVADALELAGGFREDAGTDRVNLAARVSDGEKLYFPTADEETEAEQPESGLININVADAALLCTLPGIGASRAADIIAYRETNGGFQSCEDIMQVPGIKTSVYQKIKDKITVK
ncbi:MAG: ComEA family DNA-binding protein [Roseburia sp.]|nr:ComEA family DNA-binding protein [Roseburia sp.]MCM1098668.1 ComEA family DNA-binding protein [Ruminococcus flavefaciens]